MPRPERLGPYEIIDTLAQGRAGWVIYAGYDPILRRKAALKTIPKRLLENYGAASISRLESDIMAAAHLHHPGIIGVYEFGEQFDLAYIATEYAEGPYLKERVRLPLSDAVSLITQLLSALDFAHDHDVVHRAIKPSNLLITTKGLLRVTGFGLAELDPGTPAYMSPEQFNGSAVDRRTDVFSAGIVLYELLTGVGPFAGPSDGLVSRVCNTTECPPSNANPDVPRSFDRVCARALAKAQQDRYPTARAFSEGLREAYENASGSAPTRVVSMEATSFATLVLSEADRANFLAARAHKEGPREVGAGSGSSGWDEATLRTVEKQLAAFIGPVARVKVREAASQTTDLDRLYAIAAESLKQDGERRAFLAYRTPPPTEESTQHEPWRAPQRLEPSAKGAAPQSVERKAIPEPKPIPAPDPTPQPVLRPGTPPTPAVEARPPAPLPVELKPAAMPEKKGISESRDASAPKVVSPPEKKAPQAPVPLADEAARLEGVLGKQPATLAGYLKEGPPQVEEVILPFLATVQALIAFNATGVKKEALAPQNIIFDRLGKATIETLQPTVTRGTSSAASNPRYAAPENFAEKSGSGSDSVVVASHVYALGVMFYEILLGKRLFAKTFADQRTELDWLRWHTDPASRAPSLKSMLPDYPAALSDLVESMMEKNPDKRPADLESILTRMRQIAQRSNKTVVLGKKSQASVAARPVAAKSSVPRKKSKKGLMFVLLFLVALCAGGGFFLWQNPDYFRTVIAPLLHLSVN